jgi:glycerophosphoryl diester phosphodiesterase
MNVHPEGTMEAYRASVADGAQFVEVDCYKLPDGTVVIMHDDTLDRTTDHSGPTESIPNHAAWNNVMVVGSKLSPPQSGKLYHAPTLDDVLREFANKVILVVEAKSPGTGRLIANALTRYGVDADHVMVNSFIANELSPSKAAGYQTVLNFNSEDRAPKPDEFGSFPYSFLALPYTTSEAYIRQAVSAGLKIIIHTVNQHYIRNRFLPLGVKGFYSDDALYQQGIFNTPAWSPDDPYWRQTWYRGQIPTTEGHYGKFTAPAKWGVNEYLTGKYYGCLQGWCSPLNRGIPFRDFSLGVDITFGNALQPDRWAGILLTATDHPLGNDSAPTNAIFGYHFLATKAGRLLLYKYTGGGPQIIAAVDTLRPIGTDETIRCTITRSGSTVTFARSDSSTVLSFTDGGFEGLYLTLGAKGLNADFSNVHVAPGLPPILVNRPPTYLRLGQACDFDFIAQGFPASTFQLTDGSLPPGLDLTENGKLVGVVTTVGSYTFSIQATNGVAPDDSANFSISVLDQFRDWDRQQFQQQVQDANISGPTADPDADGIPNLVEYALNSDPLDVNSRGSLSVNLIAGPTLNARYLSITAVLLASATDIDVSAEVSNDLVNWFSGPAYTEIISDATADGLRTMTWRDLAEIDSFSPRFIRLKVSQP